MTFPGTPVDPGLTGGREAIGTPNPSLGYGSTGGSVSWLKERMNWWQFYDSSHPDAALGPEHYGWDLALAVEKFQRAYGLKPTGATDPETWRAIEAAVQGVKPGQYSSFLQDQMGPLPTGPFTNPRPGMTGGGGSTNPGTVPGVPNRDAMAKLGLWLSTYGLGSVTDWMREKLLDGASVDEILLDIRQTPEFKARFPVIGLREQAGLTPVDVGTVLQYETQTRELLRQAGISSGPFMSSDYIQRNLMANDVSPAELQGRLQDGLLRVQMAPPEVRAKFFEFFGQETDAALTELFLDPEAALPELEKKAMSAYVGGVGKKLGVELGLAAAREVANTGLSEQAVWAGFMNIDEMNALFQESISETTDYTAEGEGVGAAFGIRGGDTERLQRRALARTNQLAGGGGLQQTEAGVSGLGVADS